MNEIQSNELFDLCNQGLRLLRGFYRNSISTYVELGRITEKLISQRLCDEGYLADFWQVSASTVRNARAAYLTYGNLIANHEKLFEQSHTKLLQILPDLRDKTEEQIVESLSEIKDLSVSDAKTLRKEKKGEECDHEWVERCKHCGKRKESQARKV